LGALELSVTIIGVSRFKMSAETESA
jgi:hypothetical protein